MMIPSIILNKIYWYLWWHNIHKVSEQLFTKFKHHDRNPNLFSYEYYGLGFCGLQVERHSRYYNYPEIYNFISGVNTCTIPINYFFSSGLHSLEGYKN